jgi:hypothetical protein
MTQEQIKNRNPGKEASPVYVCIVRYALNGHAGRRGGEVAGLQTSWIGPLWIPARSLQHIDSALPSAFNGFKVRHLGAEEG